MSFRKQFIINAGSSWAAMAVTMVAGIILVPVIWSRLGKEQYGIWVLLAQGLNYVVLLDRAMSLAVNRCVAYYRSDQAEVNRLVTTSVTILLIMSCMTVFCAWIISFFLTRIFSAIPESMAHQAQITCVLVGGTLGFRMLLSNFSGVLRGHQYFGRCNIVMMVYQIVRVAVVLIFLMFWESLISLQVALLISAALATVGMASVTRKSVPGLRLNIKLITRKTFKELMSQTVHSLARSGSAVVMFSTLTLLVGWKGTASEVAIYDIGFKIPSFFRGLLASTQNVFLPAASTMSAAKEHGKIRSLAQKGTYILSILTVMGVLLLFLYAEKILALWLRQVPSNQAVWVMRVILISIIPAGIFEIWLPILVGIGRLMGLTIVSVSAALLAIGVELILLMKTDIAIPFTPAIALLIVFWIRAGIWLPWYGTKQLGIPLHAYLRHGLGMPLLSTAVSLSLLMVTGRVFPDQQFPWMIRFVVDTAVVLSVFSIISLRKEIASLKKNLMSKFQK